MTQKHSLWKMLCRPVLAAVLLAGVLFSTCHMPAAARTNVYDVPDGFQVETLANVFEYPTAFSFLPDGRILVAEKSGMLKMMENGVVLAQPVIDLRGQVNDYVDRGFVDVAVDPDFTLNHYIYLFYTYRPPTMAHDSPDKVMGRIERYILRGNVVSPADATLILDDFESTRENHSVDSIRWSPEGYMFVSFGEGAPSLEVTDLALRSQSLDNLQGKIIRINRFTGEGISSNPFYDPKNPHSARSRVWAYGMRNPFRFAVNPTTGIPYVGNVGWATYESVFRALPGQNFGWPCVEGVLNRPEYQVKPGCEGINLDTVTPAEWDYPHMGGNASVTGGDFNYGTNFPASMYGTFFIADYSLQWIKYGVLGKDGKIVRIVDFATGMGEPVDLKFGPDGYLYYLSIYSGGFRRIIYTPGNHAPEVKLTTTSSSGKAPLNVSFSAYGTKDADGDDLTYAWDFGDGTQADGAEAKHVYQTSGQYLARLKVTDAKGAQRTAETLITAGEAAPVVSITAPGDYSVYLPGQTVTLTAKANSLSGAAWPVAQTGWRVTLHDGAQTRVITDTTGTTMTFTMPEATNDGAYVEALFSAHSTSGLVSASHVDLYLPPADGYIRSWWLSKGFNFATLADDAMPGGEANFVAKPGDPNVWLIHSDSASHKVNLLSYVTPGYKTVAYAFVWVDVPEDRNGLLGMMSDDGIAVWLNGKNIWRNQVSRYLPDDTRDIDLPPIELKQGLNALLVKVDQNDGDWGFKVRVLNPDGSVMQDATVKTLSQ
jgi:glucose/arabinose dehydrogenase/PKD repeat protein